MSSTHEPVSVELAHKRFKTLIKLAGLAMLVSLAVGGLGGYMILDANRGQSIPRFLLLIPGIVCVVVTCVPIRILRNRWFESNEALAAASRKEAYPPTTTGLEATQVES